MSDIDEDQLALLIQWGYTNRDIAVFFDAPVEDVERARRKLEKVF